MQIEKNTVVAIDFSLKDETDQLIDASTDGDPLIYLHGHKNIVPGLEAALEGKAQGDELQVHLNPNEAFGEHNPELRQKVPENAFQGVEELSEGMQFQAEGPNGQMVVEVVDIQEDGILIDGNHPLAGKQLNFDVKVKELREATEDEVQNGSVDEGGCCQDSGGENCCQN